MPSTKKKSALRPEPSSTVPRYASTQSAGAPRRIRLAPSTAWQTAATAPKSATDRESGARCSAAATADVTRNATTAPGAAWPATAAAPTASEASLGQSSGSRTTTPSTVLRRRRVWYICSKNAPRPGSSRGLEARPTPVCPRNTPTIRESQRTATCSIPTASTNRPKRLRVVSEFGRGADDHLETGVGCSEHRFGGFHQRFMGVGIGLGCPYPSPSRSLRA